MNPPSGLPGPGWLDRQRPELRPSGQRTATPAAAPTPKGAEEVVCAICHAYLLGNRSDLTTASAQTS